MTVEPGPIDLVPVDVGAPGYGDLHDELPLWSAPFGLWILDRVPMAPAQTVLDLGAGTGFLSIELAERCGPQATVIAVDPWHEAMRRLRRKAAHRGLRNLRLLEQDAASIELPDGSVDVIVSNLGVNNFDDPAAVVRRCARLARPGAVLLLTTNLVGHMAEFYEVFRGVLVQTGQADRLPALDAHVAHRASVGSLTTLLEPGGFAIEAVEQGSFRLRYATGSAFLRHHFVRVGFLQAWKGIATPGREAETFAVLEAALDDLVAREGELSLTIPTACVQARRRAPADLRFRDIVPADIPTLFDLRPRTRENALTLDELRALGITPDSVAGWLEATTRGWLCEAPGGGAAGFCMADRRSGELLVIAVLPEHEGRGVGAGLMQRAEAWLAQSGCTVAWLTTDLDPALRAYGFYRHRGWVDWKQERGLRWMQLDLAVAAARSAAR